MKIVVPIMPRNLEEVETIDVERLAEADIVEWRADYLPKDDILRVAPAIFEKCSGKEVVFTIRTTREGGHLDLDDQEYVNVIKEVATLYQPDYIDFEYYSYKSVFEQIFATIAMGELGKLTRIAGVITGSCWTFASLDETSAPGQMSLSNTRKFLEILEN
ncbi:type I 3-dehydroquinate dehydratase [Streptococcus suis]|uniref:type I 3-dehydroquinate dehydratase n=1 Tax=Streptococcus suis TaxID=1307 RepID=UPI0005CEE898|nr:type I 3-dehydroquinate dehydratase [Streptococcus suis]NQS56930.1 type I 3-dehydroquinate dehydratase [Streptococcus suis]CYW88790.1 3-dehydroquinate dehydratase [Streptococcus suis]